MRIRHTAERDDQGFTVIEVLIVIVVMGTLMSTLAAAIVISLRTAPNTEARLDDARSTRALATWLSYDTTSAPPFLPEQAQGGIDLASTANDCGGAGANLLHLQWTERSFTPRTYVANYRFVEDEIIRYYCAQSEGDDFVTLSARRLTRGLDPADPPTVTVTTIIETVTVNAGPPPAWTVTTPTTDATATTTATSTTAVVGPDEVVARPGEATVRFLLNGASGEQVLVDTSSRNPSSFFPSP